MPELICNTSPLQYLHQLRRLDLLHDLGSRVLVPRAVVGELEAGRVRGIDEPSPEFIPWISVVDRELSAAVRWAEELGAGETEVLLLALANPGAIAVLDDRIARRVATKLGLKFTGTLGILVDAKRRGSVGEVAPLLEQLRLLGFRVSVRARSIALRAAGEEI